ncbi:MAG TPA: FAD-binding protein, partial [Candidatus Kapabacteria bacterium]|nr:FAD-binding protein [Candidatus Kapabacteria bacterium]
MSRTYSRKEFLKLSAAIGTSLLFADCSKAKDEQSIPSPKPKPSTVIPTDHSITIIKKGDADYDSLRQGFNKRISKFPLAIALCKSTEDVADAIRYARENKLPVAVKSGGHCFEGFSSNDGGLVINLSKMRSVEWLDATTVKVGPACTLSEL